MRRVGFGPTTPICGRAKTVYASDCAATLIGPSTLLLYDKKKMENLSLRLIKLYVMIKYWGVEVDLHALLTTALVRGNWLVSGPCSFISEERHPLGLLWALELVWLR
jgi:hypothetical protein